MKRVIIPIAVLALVAIGSLHYVVHRQTCTTDNRAYLSVLKHWGKTNAIDLSRVLTRMERDNCKVGGGA